MSGRVAAMLLDSGILRVCAVEDAAPPGGMPAERLTEKSRHWYGARTVGYGRYFAAGQASERVDMLVRIWADGTVSPLDYCVLEDGTQYRIVQVQQLTDEDGLRVTDLSLERLGEHYDIAGGP